VSKTTQRILWYGVTVGLFLALVICGLAFGKGGGFSAPRASTPAPRPAPAPAPRPTPRPVAPRPVVSRPIARPRPGVIRRPVRVRRVRPLVRRGVRPVYGPNGHPVSYVHHKKKSHAKTIVIIVGILLILMLVGVAVMFLGFNTARKRLR
jgi:hypothetical protein